MSYPDNATASLAQFLFRDSQGAMYIIPRRAFHNGSQYGDTVTIVQDLSGNGNDLTGTAVFDRKPFALTDQETLNNIRDAQIIRDVNMTAPVGNLGAGCTVVRVEPGWPVEFDDLDINGNYQVTEDFSILIIIARALTESEVRVIQEMGKKWGGATFNPLVNYANGEQGAYYAPWDISTLWQDDARTVPVENYGDPVRVMDDLSPNGNHAVAPTSAARGTYGRMPVGGRRNLLLNTDTWASPAWEGLESGITKTVSDGVVTLSADADYIGSHQAARAVVSLYSHSIPWAEDMSPATLTMMVRVRQGNALVGFRSTGGGNGSRALWLVLGADGSISESGRAARAGTTFQDTVHLGSGVFRVVYTITPTRASTARDGIFVCATATGTNTVNDPVKGPFDADFWFPQAEDGDVPTPYQRVGNEYDVTQEGVPDVYYIETDGIDDCYQTAPIDLTMYDSTSLAVGVQYLGGDSAAQFLIESSANSAQNPGTYGLYKSGLLPEPWGARHRGTTNRNVTGSEPANDEVNILSMSASISEPDLTAILQGELLKTTASQGTGTLGDYSLNLLSRNADSLFFQGRFFGAIIVHPRSPYEEQNRQFLAKKAGVTL